MSQPPNLAAASLALYRACIAQQQVDALTERLGSATGDLEAELMRRLAPIKATALQMREEALALADTPLTYADPPSKTCCLRKGRQRWQRVCARCQGIAIAYAEATSYGNAERELGIEAATISRWRKKTREIAPSLAADTVGRRTR